jgi:hypothetical protein
VPEKKKERRPGASIQARPVSAKGGRVTPKGGATKSSGIPKSGHMPTSGRYTPPIPPEYRVSSRWVPITMGILLIGGMLTIVCNYLDVLPGDGANNAYLLGGLGLITAGFIVATRWR